MAVFTSFPRLVFVDTNCDLGFRIVIMANVDEDSGFRARETDRNLAGGNRAEMGIVYPVKRTV